jgi:hypothetical protein
MGALSVYGSNGNIANSHNTGSSLSIAAAAAAVAPVGFDVNSPEEMDFEATRTKRSRTEAADDDVQDHKIVITNYENNDEL